MNVQEFQKTKTEVERLKSKGDRLEGSIEQTLKLIKEEFDCDSIKQAEILLTNMEQDEMKAKEEYEEEAEVFRTQYGERLE